MLGIDHRPIVAGLGQAERLTTAVMVARLTWHSRPTAQARPYRFSDTPLAQLLMVGIDRRPK